MNDTQYMHTAMQLALRAKGQTSPNPMVGCLIVKGNKILAEGWHQAAGKDHAEVAALKKMDFKARGAKMYVTLEPCVHYGRTPPCVDSILRSGIKEIVVGMKDPNPLMNGKSIALLKNAGIKTKVGVLQKELKQMNEAFIKYIKTRMPFVVAKCAQTLDGKIATAAGDSQWITSEKTRLFARNLRNEFDAILAGIETVLKDDPRLNPSQSAKCLKKIILDSRLRISPRARLFKGIRPSRCILAVTKKARLKKIKYFQQRGVNVLICPERQGRIDLRWLFKELAKKEIVSILIEGGAHVIGSALRENLVDKMHIYAAPRILGDEGALSSVAGLKAGKIAKAVFLKNLTVQKIGRDLFLTGYVYRNH